MKSLLYLGSFSLIAAALAMVNLDASAAPKKITNSGNAKATGGNGGNASGPGSVGGNGGSATAVGGSVGTKSGTTVSNSGNATATGGNGGNASGKGSKGGNGGGAVAVGGDIGPTKIVDPVKKGKDQTKGSGNATATGGNGGNATGPGAQGGNGGDAIAVSGNNNTVINGNNNTVIGKVVNNNISLNIGGGGGGGFGGGGGGFGGGGGGGFDGGFVTPGPVAVGGFGGDGSIQGAPGIAVASSPSETVIRTDGAPAIATGQNGKDNVEEAEREQVFTRRFLKVKNESDEAMKVFVQFRGLDDKKWTWIPADPTESKDALVYDLKPGQEMYLIHKGQKVSGSRVRVWGVSEKSSWLDYRDQDLWVVPEMDARGEHRYQATEMRTFTFVFPRKTEAK